MNICARGVTWRGGGSSGVGLSPCRDCMGVLFRLHAPAGKLPHTAHCSGLVCAAVRVVDRDDDWR